MEFPNNKAASARSATLASLLGSVQKQRPEVDAGGQASGLSQQTKRQIEFIPLAKLTASKANARMHSPKQVGQIAASIQRFGFTVPVLVNGQNQILAGHGRVEAAKLLGLKEVPALRLDYLSATDQCAYAIADNRLAELAEWNRDTLAIELQGLVELNFAVEVTGFEMGEIELILHDKDEGQNESAEVEAKSRKANSGPVVSRHGDVWLLGAHRLACGEAGEAIAYAAVDVAVRRWQTFTGQLATLAGSGRSFNEVERERRRQHTPGRRRLSRGRRRSNGAE
ncbi:MAG: ParB N-terminal domain-containing protein [Xanthobacteraceae bacterium]